MWRLGGARSRGEVSEETMCTADQLQIAVATAAIDRIDDQKMRMILDKQKTKYTTATHPQQLTAVC